MKTQSSRFSHKRVIWITALLTLIPLVLVACQPAVVPATGPTANPGQDTTVPVMPTSTNSIAPTNSVQPTSTVKIAATAANTTAPASTAAVAPTSAAPVEASISIATDQNLGKILVGNNGMTLYIFTKDMPGKSNCNADCLAKWPPLLTLGSPKLGPGVDTTLVGTATLADGSKIVTYNKMPLYYWVNDKKPGDTTGQGVGSVWYVISPDGTPVEK